MMMLLFPLTCLLVTMVSSAPSEGCGRPLDQLTPGLDHRLTVSVSEPGRPDIQRDYVLHLPASYDQSNAQATPLLLDYHGWSQSADVQMDLVPWSQLADSEGFIFISMDGMNDVTTGGDFGSWNVSATSGPLGLTCDPGLVGEYPCYDSCDTSGDCSYLQNSCDWTSCRDDLAYTEAVLDSVTSLLCVDTEMMHVTGMSNGGMFIWTRIMERLAGTLASAGTVCSSPLRGYNPMPDSPISIIDFHGLLDSTIPISPDGPDNYGPGPDMTTQSSDGYYCHIKMDHLLKVTSAMNCGPETQVYPTHMDGVDGWGCVMWTGCDGGNEVVHCEASYGHDYPFNNGQIIEGLKIIWDFMKVHPNTKMI